MIIKYSDETRQYEIYDGVVSSPNTTASPPSPSRDLVVVDYPSTTSIRVFGDVTALVVVNDTIELVTGLTVSHNVVGSSFSGGYTTLVLNPPPNVSGNARLRFNGKPIGSLYSFGDSVPNAAGLINTNFLHLLENFAAPTSPTLPTTGQLWYDTSEYNFKVYTGSTFVNVVPTADYVPDPGTTPNTIPVRNNSGKLPGDITGDAVTLGTYTANPTTAANTIPVRNAMGKLPGDITGDAVTLGGALPDIIGTLGTGSIPVVQPGNLLFVNISGTVAGYSAQDIAAPTTLVVRDITANSDISSTTTTELLIPIVSGTPNIATILTKEADHFKLVATSHCTVAFSDSMVPIGPDRIKMLVLRIIQDSTGGWTVSFPSSVIWRFDTPMFDLAPNTEYVIQLTTYDQGVSWVAEIIRASSAGLNYDTDITLFSSSDFKIATQRATKLYVDNKLGGLSWKSYVRALTISPLPSVTYDNGASGVGATLTAVSNGVIPDQDTVVLVNGDGLLVKNQVSQLENGIYTVTDVGSLTTPFILTRRLDADSGDELVNATVYVSEGSTLYQDTQWTCNTNAPIVVGTTALTSAQVNMGAMGTVTSVSLTTPSFLSVTGYPITSSGTLAINYSGTALPISSGGTGLTSLSSGIQSFLAEASSANLAAAVTDETGTGSLVFSNSPTIMGATLTSGSIDNATIGSSAPSTGNFSTLSVNSVPVLTSIADNLIATWISPDPVAPITTPINPIYCVSPYSGNITEVTVLTEGGTGSANISLSKATFANFPTFTNIVSTNPLVITNSNKLRQTTFTGWTLSVAAGEIISFELNSSSTFKLISVFLKIQSS